MSADQDKQIKKLARDITRYLQTHPNAADSVEGITNWWLSRQRFVDSVERVQKALDLLASEGVVKKKELVSGNVIYVKNID